MKVSGRGDVFLADRAADVHLIDLDQGDSLSVNGANVLAFEPTLEYDIKRVQGMGMLSAAGLFNCVFSGKAGSPSPPRAPRSSYGRPAHLRRPAGRHLLVGVACRPAITGPTSSASARSSAVPRVRPSR